MIIAVNTRLWTGSILEGVGYFTREVSTQLCLQNPNHQFYFIFDRPPPAGIQLPANAKALVLGPAARHPLLWKIWFDWKIPALLKKIKADVFFSPDGFCSLRTSVPQCMVVHDLGFLHHPQAYRPLHRSFYRRYLPKFVRKVASVATVSAVSKQDLLDQYKVNDEKITIVHSAAKEVFAPQNWDQQCITKEKYTDGKEYFLYIGAIQPRKNLLNLLKAFSIFKKRQKSEWKLVLAGRLAWKTGEFEKLLATYKFRQDVVLTGYLPEEELAGLAAAAYSLVYPSLFEGFGVPVLEGMRSGVPVITSSGTSMEEIGGDAALYFNPEDPADIADKMMRLYKDESLCSDLVRKGKDRAALFSWPNTAELVWKAIMKTMK